MLTVNTAHMVRYKKGDPDSKLDFFAISSGVVEISQRKAALEHAIALRDNAKGHHRLTVFCVVSLDNNIDVECMQERC